MDSELDDRKAAILRAVVEDYIETAQPVGSGHVAGRPDVPVSSATVRNELAALEKEGFLVQPHTSAGRIPTDKGYRFFVDRLQAGPLDPAARQQVREFFAKAHGELEQMLQDTSRLLSQMTSYAAVVVSPPTEAASLRSVQVVSLAPKLALVVAVLSNGSVVKHSLELAEEVAPEQLGALSAHLSAHLVGRVALDMPVLPATGDELLDRLAGLATHALSDTTGPDHEQVFLGGASRMASAFDAVDTVRSVLGALEQQYVVVSLLRDVLDRGLSVAIGHEHGLLPLAECAVVVAPYGGAGGDGQGTIGVLGPTRMNYPQALAAVAVVSQRLDRRLEEG
ncbi:MAG: heat-inducible transcriptional repressor HrcA [Acidimicrobiales bacterium]